MPEILQTTVDKFTFRVPADRLFTPEGLWLLPVPGGPHARVRIGLTDYLQQRSGDLAFAEATPVGTPVRAGDEIGRIETIKATIDLASPVDGTVVEVNGLLKTAPEIVNQDPYGDGWLVVVEPEDWEAQRARLMDPATYFARMKMQAEEEVKAL